MKKLIVTLALIAGSVFGADWVTTNTTHVAAVPRLLYSQTVSTNVPSHVASLRVAPDGITVLCFWHGPKPAPTQAQFDAVDREAAGAFVDNEDGVE